MIAPTAEHLVAVGASGPVPQNDHVAGVSLAARLYASKHTHRLVPARLAIALAGSLGPFARQRRNSAERRAAEDFMADLLLHTPRATEAQELAQRWLVEKSVLRELMWRPWLLKRSRILGREHWDVAHLGGRACLIVTGHIGATWATFSILAPRGLDLHVVAHPYHWQPMPPGDEGLARLHRRREYIEKSVDASRIILSDGPPQRMLELLQAGEFVGIAFDVAGSAATPFLGRRVALAGGVATAAFRAKAMVLPIVAEPRDAVPRAPATAYRREEPPGSALVASGDRPDIRADCACPP
jgi:hypothetical protein